MESNDTADRRGAWASSTPTVRLARPSVEAAARVCSTISGEMSIPTARPCGPTPAAARSSTAPRPQPTSSQRSPGSGGMASTRLAAIGWKKSTPEAS